MHPSPANPKNYILSPCGVIPVVVFLAAWVLFPSYHLLTESHASFGSVRLTKIHDHSEGHSHAPLEHGHYDPSQHQDHPHHAETGHPAHPASDHELIMICKVSMADFTIYPADVPWYISDALELIRYQLVPGTLQSPYPGATGPPLSWHPSRAPPAA